MVMCCHKPSVYVCIYLADQCHIVIFVSVCILGFRIQKLECSHQKLLNLFTFVHCVEETLGKSGLLGKNGNYFHNILISWPLDISG